MILEKLVSRDIASIHARNGMIHQKFCIELRYAGCGRNSSEALTKIVSPLRQCGSIFLLLDKVP